MLKSNNREDEKNMPEAEIGVDKSKKRALTESEELLELATEYLDVSAKYKELEGTKDLLNKKIKFILGNQRVRVLKKIIKTADAEKVLEITDVLLACEAKGPEEALKYENVTVFLDGLQVKTSNQDRSKFNTLRAVGYFKSKGLNQYIKVVEIPDEEAIEEAIDARILNLREIQKNCIDVQIIPTLKVVKDKKE
jgi:hypothetical protein